MSVEIDEVRDFLAQHDPFTHLSEDELGNLASAMKMQYLRRGQVGIDFGEKNEHFYVIRSGAVDLLSSDGTLLDRLDAGRTFGYSTLVGEPEFRYQTIAQEDTLVLVGTKEVFEDLIGTAPVIQRFYSSNALRLAHETSSPEMTGETSVLSQTVGGLVASRGAIVSQSHVSIKQAAQTMVEHKISSLLIVDDDVLCGLITDKDLRKRVVAEGKDTSISVSEIMTPNPLTISTQAQIFEAMLLMAEHSIHHVPVMDGSKLVGMITSGDVARLLQVNPVFLAADVSNRPKQALADAYRRAAETVVALIGRGVSARSASQMLTTVADALVRRLIALYEEENGPAPIEFAFVAVGSQGRQEMGPASDQDNALIYSDDFDEEVHGAWFAGMAEFVCKGLDHAGQVLCPGNMMAMNPQWRMTHAEWINTFHRWITAPKPDALLNAQIYFDMRVLAGSEELGEQVHSAAVQMAKGATRMHAHLAALATWREPPLGFFRGLVVEKNGEYADTLDIKRGGTAAVVQMARLYAIQAGVNAVQTHQRLEEVSGTVVTEASISNLKDAFDYLTNLTWQHQAEQIKRGEATDYHINPKELGTIQRENLRDSFTIIKKLQHALAQAHPVRNV